MERRIERFKLWAQALKRDVFAMWIAARSNRTPWLAKMVAGCVAAYAFSPIDLIPDFIPIVGYLDDLVIVPLGIALALRLIPAPLMSEFRAEALQISDRPVNYVAAAFVAIVWATALLVSGNWILGKVV